MLLGVTLGAVLGVLVAASTVPVIDCTPDDGMCRLQKLYLAQGVKVVGGMLAGYLVMTLVFVRAPDAVHDHRAAQRRRSFVAESRASEAAERGRRLRNTQELARRATQAETAGLPPAAMRAIAGLRHATPPVGRPVERHPQHPGPVVRQQRPPGLPPAALDALSRRSGPAVVAPMTTPAPSKSRVGGLRASPAARPPRPPGPRPDER